KQLRRQGDNRMIVAQPKDMGWIDKLVFKVDDHVVSWEYLKDTIDVAVLHLAQPLMPGQKITISTPFHVRIPSSDISRFGHSGQAYFITQWYPKPAVYDNRGWNYFPYLDMGEFYSEFGSFDVFITLPSNYVVGATGDFVDGEKELKWLDG